MEFRPMSPDEIERTVQFLLQQQARFAADFDRLSEKSERMMEAIVGLTGIAGRTVGLVEGLAERMDEHGRRTEEQFRRTDARLSELSERTDARIAELSEQITRTDAHLGVVIEMFERHLREDHGREPS